MVEHSATLPRTCGRRYGGDGGGGVGGAIGASASAPSDLAAAAMAARRRRNRTVHFGDNLLVSYPVAAVAAAAVALKRTDCSSHSGSASSLPGELFEPNVQQLFNFIESVLSAWDDSGAADCRPRRSNSVPATPRLPASKERRQQRLRRAQQHQRGLNEPAAWARARRPLPLLPPVSNGTPVFSRRFLRIRPEPKACVVHRKDDPTGCKCYGHEHWPITANECNVAFLTKVISFFFSHCPKIVNCVRVRRDSDMAIFVLYMICSRAEAQSCRIAPAGIARRRRRVQFAS